MSRFAIVALAGMVLSSPDLATAEVLSVEGIYAAREPGAIGVEEISIERFGGDVGEELAIALVDRLEEVRLDSQPYFTVKSGSGWGNGYPRYDAGGAVAGEPVRGAASLRGAASGELYDVGDGDKEVTHCVRRNDRKKCVEKATDTFPCRRLTIRFQPMVRLIAREGGRLYAAEDRLERSQRYCADERSDSSPTAMMQSMIDEFAMRVRYDLAPELRREDVRIMESRKGLAKADSAAFKKAVRLTKVDPAAACQRFDEMLVDHPDHSSVLFNVGLCAEADGRLDDAARLYDRVMATPEGRDYARAGLDRVDSRIEAGRQLARRYSAAD